jgi:hypothetical protein
MSIAFNKFNAYVADVHNKVHNLGSDTLKLMLSNTAPVATNAVKTDITEISAGNGYSAGGPTVTVTGSTQTGGTYTLAASATVITATGAIGPFRYCVLYNSTAASGNLIGWYDYGSAITMQNTDTFTVTYSSGIFTCT